MADEHVAVLFINRNDSRCGNCGKGADPYAKAHDRCYGYAREQPPGCGVTWTHVSSDYNDHDGLHDGIRAMRPDLIAVFNEFMDLAALIALPENRGVSVPSGEQK